MQDVRVQETAGGDRESRTGPRYRNKFAGLKIEFRMYSR